MKKSWHPGLIKNRAQVWEDQHSALQERKRIEALRKEIEEERAANELQKLNEANGGAKRQERVEFLYAGPGAGSGMAEDREAYLLGRKRIDDVLGKDNMGEDAVSQKPASTSVAPGLNMRDLSNKVALDPLFAMKKQEAAQYEALVNKKKAELEAEARKAARRDTRRPGHGERYPPSRHEDGSRRRSHRDEGSDRHRDRYPRSHRERSSSRDRREDSRRHSRRSRDENASRRDKSPSRQHRARRSPSSPRSDSRSESRGRRSRDYHERSTRKPHRSRSPASAYSARQRFPPEDASSNIVRASEVSGAYKLSVDTSTAEKDERAQQAARLAEMNASAKELDDIRDRRLALARQRDGEERVREEANRSVQAKRPSGFVRDMQLSAGLVR